MRPDHEYYNSFLEDDTTDLIGQCVEVLKECEGALENVQDAAVELTDLVREMVDFEADLKFVVISLNEAAQELDEGDTDPATTVCLIHAFAEYLDDLSARSCE